MGYVVRDIESAMRNWTTTLHIGPFYYVDRLPIINICHQGASGSPRVSLALACSGNLQIELIQQRDNTPSSYLSFLAAGHEGLHHIGFFSEHYDLDLHRAAAAGLHVEQFAAIGNPVGKSTCFASRGPGEPMLNLVALNAANRELYQMVQTEAERWDGSGPVRRIEL
ncbi:MAG: VOC family protein [Betaproteobacteria bacterium]|nr:VOC family protein [Betaproteobacteria bacterium]